MVGTSNLGSWNGHWFYQLSFLSFESTEAVPHDDESDDGNDGRYGKYGHHGQGHGQGPRATKGTWRNQGHLAYLCLFMIMYGLFGDYLKVVHDHTCMYWCIIYWVFMDFWGSQAAISAWKTWGSCGRRRRRSRQRNRRRRKNPRTQSLRGRQLMVDVGWCW